MTYRTQNRLVIAGGLLLLLSLLGFGARKMQRLGNGIWGGQHIQFHVSDGSAAIEYDCAHGSITGPLTFDTEGRFSWRGSYIRERGGPVRIDDKVNSQPATVLYAGIAPGLPQGANQINVQLPEDARTGTISIVWTVGGVSSQPYTLVQ